MLTERKAYCRRFVRLSHWHYNLKLHVWIDLTTEIMQCITNILLSLHFLFLQLMLISVLYAL